MFLVVPIANIFFYHYLIWGSVWLALFSIALISPFLIRDILYLRGKVVVLDKREDQVHVNGKCMCALTEVRAVRLGSYIRPTAKDLPFKIRAFYLETTKGEAVEIERATDFGSGYKEVGLAIADFAQVKSNISKE